MRKVPMRILLFALIIFFVSAISFSQAPVDVSSTYRGDINEDGQVNIFDLLEMLKMLPDPGGRPERAQQIADMDDNGSVNIFDLLGLLRVLSGGEEPGAIIWGPAMGDTAVVQGITMVYILGGSFKMGTNDTQYPWLEYSRPVHTVTLSAFWMSRYEITQAQYKAVTGTNPSYFTKDENCPVEQVSWYDAVASCNKLSEAAGLEPCYDLSTWECDFTKNGFRLPTEAEWEYACRAGTTTRFYTGDSYEDIERAAWHLGLGDSTHPVGLKEANGWGLYDMHGNVWEWCNDRWTNYYTSESQTNPTGPESGTSRVIRGGSLKDSAYITQSAWRDRYYQGSRQYSIGFRVVRRESFLQH
ncbi:MAG TPA: SUMF1/EgtB/PvdO family nonheme iron enzyme [archaeon]|nr:SUMF1/EgtB/PvdO family nonheme iron enzyme [archaeon]